MYIFRNYILCWNEKVVGCMLINKLKNKAKHGYIFYLIRRERYMIFTQTITCTLQTYNIQEDKTNGYLSIDNVRASICCIPFLRYFNI